MFFPRLEIPNRFQKGSVKLTFFWEGQLEPETAQPEPTLPGNLARLGQCLATTDSLVGRNRDSSGSLLPSSLGIPDHIQSLSLKVWEERLQEPRSLSHIGRERQQGREEQPRIAAQSLASSSQQLGRGGAGGGAAVGAEPSGRASSGR